MNGHHYALKILLTKFIWNNNANCGCGCGCVCVVLFAKYVTLEYQLCAGIRYFLVGHSRLEHSHCCYIPLTYATFSLALCHCQAASLRRRLWRRSHWWQTSRWFFAIKIEEWKYLRWLCLQISPAASCGGEVQEMSLSCPAVETNPSWKVHKLHIVWNNRCISLWPTTWVYISIYNCTFGWVHGNSFTLHTTRLQFVEERSRWAKSVRF